MDNSNENFLPVRQLLRWQIIAASVTLFMLWVLVIHGLGVVFAHTGWQQPAHIMTGATLLIACLIRLFGPRARWLAVLGGGIAGIGYWVLWFWQTQRPAMWWGDTTGVIDEIDALILTGSAPLDPAGPLEEVILLVIFTACAFTMLLLIGFSKPVAAGSVGALFLVIPAAVTAEPLTRSMGWPGLLAAGALIIFLVWISSPAPSLQGFTAAVLALAVAGGAMMVAPATQDRIWNSGLSYAPVSSAVPDVTISLAEDLRERRHTRAFTFTAAEAGPYRFSLATLTEFSDGNWLTDDAVNTNGYDATVPRTPMTVPPSMLDSSPEKVRNPVSITIEGLKSSWLPLPQSSTQIFTAAGDDGDFDPSIWQWAATSNTAQSEDVLTNRGNQYQADGSQLINYSEETLEALGSSGGSPLYDEIRNAPTSLQPYLQLPNSVPAELTEPMQEILGDSAEDRGSVGYYLEAFFRSGSFDYSESAPYEPGMDPDDPYAVMLALLNERSGFCVHYASTFAVMARTAGAPARVVVGYAAYAQADQETVVRGTNLHAWPEIYFDNLGWVAFEPTPGGAGVNAETESQGGEQEQDPEPEEPTDDPSSPDSPDVPDATMEDIEPDAEPGSQASEAESPHSITPALIIGFGALLALIFLPGVLRFLRTRRRLTRATGGKDPAHNLWVQFYDTAIDLQLFDAQSTTQNIRAQTPEAMVEHLVSRKILMGSSAQSAQHLAAAVASERYSQAGSAPQLDAKELLENLHQAQAGLKANVPRVARVKAFLMPRSLFRFLKSDNAKQKVNNNSPK